MKVRIAEKAARVLCAAAMAAACVPLCSQPAHAASVGAGNSFTVDNLTYTVTAGFFVAVSGVEDRDALPSTFTLPQTVTYNNDTYTLIGVYPSAFKNCTNLVDLRIPDIEDGAIYGVAFEGCTNLKVIHMLGRGSFTNPGSTTAVDFGGVEDLSLVYHQNSFNFYTAGQFNRSSVTFPKGTTAYYAVDFQQGDISSTVYVAGITATEGTYGSVEQVTVPADFADPSKVKVYCDAQMGEESLCPESQVPALEAGEDSWVATTNSMTSETHERLSALGTVNAPLTAVASDSKDLTNATMTAESLCDTGTRVDPACTVLSSLGEELEQGRDYSLAVDYENGEECQSSSGDTNPYTRYPVKATGTGSFRGVCQTTLKVFYPLSKWYRAWGADQYANAQTIASQGTVIGNQSYSDRSSSYPAVNRRGEGANGWVYSSARVVVNPDDYASCLVAESLAGLFGVTVISVPAELTDGELPARVKSQITSARNGIALVLGSKEYISDDVRYAIADIVDGGAPRVSGDTDSAAQIAVNAYNFIRSAEDGTFSMTLPDSFISYKDTALVIPGDSKKSEYFSAAAWAWPNIAPVFFCNEDGTIDDATKAALQDTDPETGEPYFTKVVVPGVSDATAQNLSAALPQAEVKIWESGVDSCASSVKFAEAAAQTGTTSYGLSVFADSASDWGSLAAAACTAGAHGGSLLLVDFNNDWQGFLSLVKSHFYEICYGVVAAGYTACTPQRYEELTRMWDFGSALSNEYLSQGEVEVLTPKMDYDGTAKLPTIRVTDSQGNVLSEGKDNDYTIKSYMNNSTGELIDAGQVVDPGSYTVTVAGTYTYVSGGFGRDPQITGYYQGTRSATFEITGELPDQEPVAQPPAKAQIKKVKAGKRFVKATWAKVSKATKYQLQYRIMGSSSWKSAKAGAKATSLKVKGLFVNRRYEVRLRAGNAAGWGAWSATKLSAKVK